MKKKRILFSLLYLLLPSILIITSPLIGKLIPEANITFYPYFIYITSLIGIALYFIFKPCKLVFLIAGAVISPLFVALYAFFTGNEINIVQNTFNAIIFYYAFPFSMISLFVYGILKYFKKD